MISKSLSTSEKRARLHQAAGRMAEFCQAIYPLIVSHADDWGRLDGSTFHVKYAIDPSSPRPESDFGKALTFLSGVGLIDWYEADGRKCIQIKDFDRHQEGLHKRTERSSRKFPEPPENSPLREEKRNEEKRTEDNGNEPAGKVKPFRAKTALDEPMTFTAFYHRYPRKVKREEALKAWIKLAPSGDLVAAIHSALDWQIGQPDWQKEGGKFVPFPASWLNSKRWQDEPFNPTNQDDDPNAEAFARVLGGQHGNS